MRRSREPFYKTPPVNPLPQNPMSLQGSTASKGYEVLARAERGMPRMPIAPLDRDDGPGKSEIFSDR